MTLSILGSLVFAISLSGLLCRLALGFAKRWSLLDQPGSEAHKQQSYAVPNTGGIAMVLAMALSLGVHSLWSPIAINWSLIAVAFGSVGLFILGAIDDRRPLPAVVKLVLQFAIISLSVVYADIGIDVFNDQPLLSFGIAIMWCVMITNAYNLLDHADGLSSTIAIISLVVLVSASLMANDADLAAFHLILIGVIGGFLIWNLPPARIYMGDAGSLPLGFLVAAGCLQVTFWDSGDPDQNGTFALFAPLLVSAIPVYDLFVVVVKRLRNSTPIMQGDRNHISHRLNRLGLSQTATLAAVAALQTAIAASALILRHANPTIGVVVLLQAFSVLLAAVLLEARRDHYR